MIRLRTLQEIKSQIIRDAGISNVGCVKKILVWQLNNKNHIKREVFSTKIPH